MCQRVSIIDFNRSVEGVEGGLVDPQQIVCNAA